MRFILDPLHFALQKELRWSHPNDFGFLRDSTHLPVCPVELRHLCTVLPLALRGSGQSIEIVALIGEEWSAKPAIGEAGEWCPRLMPQALAVHPFGLAIDDTFSVPVVMIARNPACVRPDGENRFFADDATPTPEVTRTIRRMQRLEAGKSEFAEAAAFLEKTEFLMPLPIPAVSRASSRSTRYWTLDRERFAEANAGPLQPDDPILPFVMRLAAALLISQQNLAAPLRHRLCAALSAEDIARSMERLLAKRVVPLDGPADHERTNLTEGTDFLVEDDVTLTFDFTASGSVFSRG